VKRLVVSTTIAAIVAGGAGFAFAGQPGPNGHNDYGLCKAYFAGSQKGQDNKQQKGPFPALKSKAGDQDGDGDTDNDDVRAYCANTVPGGKSKSSSASRTSSTTVSATRIGL